MLIKHLPFYSRVAVKNNQKGKTKRFGKSTGRRDNIRKAYVTLKPGQELNIGGEAA